MAFLLKLLMMGLGAVLVALGVVISPLPGPMGLPLMVLGLILMLRNSTWLKRQFMRQVRKHPRALGPVRALLRPGAKFLAIIWLAMLRCERVVLPFRFRFLYRLRQTVRSWFRRPRHAVTSAS